MSTPDIVDRLLRVKSPQLKYLLHEAAEQIRRLRESVAQAIQDSDERTKTHTDGSPNSEALTLECNRLADRLVAMRAERDRARREICEGIAALAPSMSAEQLARERGWDCFKEKR